MNSAEDPTKTYRIVKYCLFFFTLAFFFFAGSRVLNSTLAVSGKAKSCRFTAWIPKKKKWHSALMPRGGMVDMET